MSIRIEKNLFDTSQLLKSRLLIRATLQMKGMRKRYFTGGGILLAAIVYLLYLSLGSSVSYYVTVSELYNVEANVKRLKSMMQVE